MKQSKFSEEQIVYALRQGRGRHPNRRSVQAIRDC